jgi:hypothetical protein
MSTTPKQPLTVDTDGDGLSDQDEWSHRTDPRREDTDFDGLSDDAELRLGTDPLQWDSDFDGHGDGTEIALQTDPNWREVRRRVEIIDRAHVPRAGDPDGDGLPDHVEFSMATDMGDPDTDGDGLGDWVEFLRGSDPNNAHSNGALESDLEAVERELPGLRAAEGPKVPPAIITEFGHRIVFPGDPATSASLSPDSFVDPGSAATPPAFESDWSAIVDDSSAVAGDFSPSPDDASAVDAGSDTIDADVSMA